MIRTSLGVGIAVLVLSLTAPALSAAAEIDIVGLYTCEGTNPDGRPYRSVVEIIKNDQTYRVTWAMGERNISIGIGMVRDGLLAVSYYANGNLGVIVYRIKKGPQLTGEWTVLGADDEVFPETLTKIGVSVTLEPADIPTGRSDADGGAF